MAVAISSATGVLSLLNEEDDALRLYALQVLNKLVHEFWFQVASSIASVEAFYEDEEFGHRDLAALVASKVFYHLGELDDALSYALGAGALFDLSERSEYVETILARCIDSYIEQRQKAAEDKSSPEVDPRLTAIVERMFDRCTQDAQYEQAIGIALESRRLDRLEQIVTAAPDQVHLLAYSLDICNRLVVSRDFRQEVLRLLIRLYEAASIPDWVNICQCLMFLDDPQKVAHILDRLLKGSQDDCLLAYQICFDLFENEMQSFVLQVAEKLDSLAPPPPPQPAAAAAAPAANGDAPAVPTPSAPAATDNGAADGASAMETDDAGKAPEAGSAPAATEPTAAAAPAPAPEESEEVKSHRARLADVKRILAGSLPIALHLEFLYSHNHADLQILKNMKGAIEARNSVCHAAVIFANAIMHSGTTIDTFLRENLDWLSRATNWSKFSATAGLGVIHRGHLSSGRSLLAPYLPTQGASASPFSEGGALYALGLIHANHGQDIRSFLLDCLRSASHEVVQHGACLGLGLAALGSNDEELFEDLKSVLYTDSAIAGEAAGYALGLLCVGSATDKATELLAYAHDTQHEKIIRGLAMGLAMIMYGREEGAETLIEQMSRDQDPILRYGGMYTIGLAYRGTSNNGAIQKLLHFAVSDVSDNVRRAAVTCLGFVLMNNPAQCPRIVALLAESYNPHVRYGAALAVGLACSASGLPAAQRLLEPLMKDAVDFVRQGALIASALVLMQQPESKVAGFRKQIEKLVADKHEEVMCRMGAILAAGILDAGGRNVAAALRSPAGHFRRTAVLGLAMFAQYWFWYPLSYFFSLALRPTALIGLDSTLRTPQFEVTCQARPSLFAYPPPVTTESGKDVAKIPQAVLSTTARAKDKAKRKAAEKEATEGDKMDTGDKTPASGEAEAMETDEKAGEGAASAEAGAKPAAAPEASSFQMANPSRVLPDQEKFIRFKTPAARFAPMKRHAAAGFVVLKDSQPDKPVEYTSTAGPASGPGSQPAPTPAAPPAAAQNGNTAEDDEPPPPEPFEYVPSS
ncbi:hypothetical protein WJX74_011008 [Apatococcus lobatus]|uniref:26S proteasome non-ATPase regulatory subunit 1 homolog n=1 Tax=Apatococcus lobatus TaxID=904363 RepID=A0AAW1QN25_9CHLO